MTKGLFTPEQPGLEFQYWKTLSTVLTRLEISVEAESLTEDMSTALSQLTRLQRFYICTSSTPTNAAHLGVLDLTLPQLQWLSITCLNPNSIRLNCPQLGELFVGMSSHSVPVKSFSGMPNSIWKLSLSLQKGSPSLQEILPPQSTKLLEDLTIGKDILGFTDPEAMKAVCLNGKLRRLIVDSAAAHAGAFLGDASWQAVPQTLQEIVLSLPLDEGIPKILEQLLNLTRLSLKHSGTGRMHLDRPLDPFLDMPKLERLELQSPWNEKLMNGTNICMWTPPALSLLGSAQLRIMQMQDSLPRTPIALIY